MSQISFSKECLIGERQEAQLVEGLDEDEKNATRNQLVKKNYIRSVGDGFTKEDVLVRVKRVDDNAHQTADLRLEMMMLLLLAHELKLCDAVAIGINGLLLST